jgi:lysophospholipase L1-like esterase
VSGSRVVPVAARVLAVALGLMAALLVAEIVARRIFWLPYLQDPRLGAILPADTHARYCREGCGTSYWVRDGVRNSAPPDPARRTVLALGDSFTEALMTDDAAVYTQRTEAALTAAGHPLQILNLGRSGASAADYVALAPFYDESFDPDWTVIQLRDDDLEGAAWDPGKTHFRLREDGSVEAIEVPPRPSALSLRLLPLRQRLALVALGNTRLREFAAAAAAEPPLFGATRVRAPAALPAIRPVVAEVAAMAAAHAERVTFLYLPEFDPRAPGRVPDTEALVAAACAARGWSCVNLRESFAAFAARDASPYGFANSRFNAGHMNDAGHAAAAELLRRELERLATLDLL